MPSHLATQHTRSLLRSANPGKAKPSAYHPPSRVLLGWGPPLYYYAVRIQGWPAPAPQAQEDSQRSLCRARNMGDGEAASLRFRVPSHPQRHSPRCQNAQHLRRCAISPICKPSPIQLGDLGVSKILKTDCGLYSRVGTPLYLAPEIIRS